MAIERSKVSHPLSPSGAQGKGSFQHVAVALLLLGFVGYMFFHMQTNRLFWGLLGEIQSGTLEQMYLSPLPSWVLLLGLAVASIVEALITAVLMYLLIRLIVPVTIPLRLSALLPLILLVVGSVGYSLMVGGLTLRFKRLEILKELLQGLVFLLGGVFCLAFPHAALDGDHGPLPSYYVGDYRIAANAADRELPRNAG